MTLVFRYAQNGFPISQRIANDWRLPKALPLRNCCIDLDPDSVKTWYIDGKQPVAGQIYRNPDLAKTFKLMQEHGKDAFYKGEVAQALVAKERVGETGRVSGIDPSRSLLAAARRKARRAGLRIDFQPGAIEHIPAPAQSFDVVLSTFMMHHVPDPLKYQGLAEIARILKAATERLAEDPIAASC